MMRDNDVFRLINQGIELSKDFRSDFKDEEKLDAFLNLLDDILNILGDNDAVFENHNLQEYQKIYLQENNGDGGRFTETLGERDLAWKRKEPAQLILYNSSYWQDALQKEDADIEMQQEKNPYDDSPIGGIWADMDEFITKGTGNQFNKKKADYYKNFMSSDDQDEFVTMMEFIKSEIIQYSLNLTYVNKIVPVLEEYRKKGIYPTQTIFLNHYVATAVLDMVMTASKLFSVTDGENKFGFAYLKNWLGKRYHDILAVTDILGNKDLKELMKRGEGYRDSFENIRNRYLAHYDPRELDILSKFSIDRKTLEEIYNLCIKVVGYLSFNYFHCNDKYCQIIEHQGFNSIFQNPWVSQVEKCDLDVFLEILKKSEIEKISAVEK